MLARNAFVKQSGCRTTAGDGVKQAHTGLPRLSIGAQDGPCIAVQGGAHARFVPPLVGIAWGGLRSRLPDWVPSNRKPLADKEKSGAPGETRTPNP
jgi:hypothetical protein